MDARRMLSGHLERRLIELKRMRDVAKALKPVMKYSVFYQDATIEMALPSKV